MANPTVEVEGTEYDAEDLLEAIEQTDPEDKTTINIVGDVVVQGDGFSDPDGYIHEAENGRITGRTSSFHNLDALKRKCEDVLESGREDVPYLRATSGDFGCEIPVTADFVMEKDESGYMMAWRTEDNVDGDLRENGADGAKEDGYDGHAFVNNIEIVDD
jgi:hypothetical protein